MKRFHVHVHVHDLARSVAFQSKLFATEPARAEADYDEGETTCCYARSEKRWIADPQGVAWEHFHTLGDIPLFHEAKKTKAEPAAAVCCGTAAARGKPVAVAVKATTGCC